MKNNNFEGLGFVNWAYNHLPTMDGGKIHTKGAINIIISGIDFEIIHEMIFCKLESKQSQIL